MRLPVSFFLIALQAAVGRPLAAQTITGTDEFGNFTQIDSENGRNNFNPHGNDSTRQQKEVPKGLYVWTVDRKLGDIRKAEVDTMPHLYPHTTMTTGTDGSFNTVGSNYTARLSRIFINRPETEQFLFTQPYSYTFRNPDEHHFTNTLSPITNLSYDNCGDKTNGEDHLRAKFAVNAGKKTGMGCDVDYAYARGYYQNQSLSHFGATFYVSHLGDQYQMHMLFTTRHQKATENGGITNDDYVTHPELSSEDYTESEIPTVLSSNWNRNNMQQLFLTHRYNLGFYRQVKMTDEEIKARQFAQAAQSENSQQGNKKKKGLEPRRTDEPAGRPDNAKIADAPMPHLAKADSIASDTTRVKVDSKAVSDSLLAEQAHADSLAALMKQEFVPVTSFIHTLELQSYDHIYQAYQTPANYYANTFYNSMSRGYTGDSIYDQTKHLLVRNTLGLGLLEGFNKWARAGIKGFATHELRRFDMPQLSEDGSTGFLERWTEHNVSVGGMLSKTQGQTLHYQLMAETWIAGEDAGQLKLDFQTDLNFPLLGDTVRLEAKAYFHRLHPTFFERQYHSKHFWWDQASSLDKITRTRVEGIFSYEKTHTRLRAAIEEIQNYTYFTMSYAHADDTRTGMTASVEQQAANLNVLTLQLQQPLSLGPVHWDNTITYQSSSNDNVLPLPTLNVFSNLYLQFTVAHVLRVELGAAATYFTKYYAPDFCPQLNQYAIQQNSESRVEIGNFPFIDLYANLHLKHTRFFVMMTNATATSFDRMYFLAPHYPQNTATLHIGVSWNFFN